MLVLDTVNKSITVAMSGAAATTNPDFVTAYSDDNGTTFVEGSSDGALNGTSQVTLVSAPAASTRRLIKSIYIENKDTAAVTITVTLNSSSTLRTIAKVTLQVGDTWSTDGTTDTNGNIKTVQGAVSLTTGVTGILPVLNGGTGVTTSTGSGNTVLSTTPTLITPILGTPTSVTLTNGTGLPISTGVSGLGTGVATALAINTGSSGAVVVNGGALGTPSSGTLTNATGLPISTGVSGLGTGVATFLATPSSANLATAVTDETGSGSLVFATSPTLVTPTLGTPSSVTLTNGTGLPISTGVSGLGTGVATFLATPSSANLASAVTDETGSGLLVFATTPTLTNPTVTNYVETLYSVTGSATLALTNGTVQKVTTSGSTTITLPASVSGKSFTVIVYYAAADAITWAGGTTLKWAGGTTPTATSATGKYDIFNFYQDGTNTYGSIFGQNY